MSWGLTGVTVRYGRQARPALADVSLDLPEAGIRAVVGGDGAGKSTLLRALVGLVAVESGAVRRPGRQHIGYLSPTSGTYPDLSVDENLAFAATAYGTPAPGRDPWTAELLERAGLAPFRHRLAGRLSGGMRQKLGVVRALAHRPRLVVLDEPTTGVDPVSRADVWWLIARAAAEGAAVVVTTTYLDEAERAGRLVVLHGGRALGAGTPAEVVASVPGSVERRDRRPAGDEAGRAWRRGRSWRVWDPAAAPAGSADLADAVVALALADARAPEASR